tara:strand:+ start:593 stop:1159 length:567 start_codon:yes stop_codon:yes gene_type:complete
MSNTHEVTLRPVEAAGPNIRATVSSLPSQSHTLLDFSKVAIGFVSLIMGFSITFLGGEIDGWAKVFLLATWGTLIVTAILSCLTIACVANDSIHERLSRRGTLISNLSFLALVISLICFSVFGYFNVTSGRDESLSNLVETVVQAMVEEPHVVSDLTIEDEGVSFALRTPAESFIVSIQKQAVQPIQP